MRICFIGTNTRFGLCALISAYSRETALKKRILYPYVVYADIRICGETAYMRCILDPHGQL